VDLPPHQKRSLLKTCLSQGIAQAAIDAYGIHQKQQSIDSAAAPACSIHQARQYYAQGQIDRTALLCSQILGENPRHAEALHLAALVQWRHGHHSQAVSLLKQAVEIQPDQPMFQNNLGVFLNETGLYAQAAEHFETALRISPDYHAARCNLGLAWFHLKMLVPAYRCLSQVVRDCPTHAPARANLGMVLLAQGAAAPAAETYEHAVAIDPYQPLWWSNLGAARMTIGEFSKAAACFQRAIALDPSNADPYNHLAVSLRAQGDFNGTIVALQKALQMKPNHEEALSNLCIAFQQTCQWDSLHSLLRRLEQSSLHSLQNGNRPAEQPMFNIWRSSNPSLNLTIAQAWSREAEQMALRAAKPFSHQRPTDFHRQITIGYLSYDFRNHPVAHQLLPIFGLHDRKRFRVLAFSMGPDDGSTYRSRIQNTCDQFIDIGSSDLARSAQIINDCGTDILIDLMGHSHHNRLQIPALRPAPVQVGYLGFLASTGADFIDYLITDEAVVPVADNGHFIEKLIRMPHCYQVNHKTFFPTRPPAGRECFGLPVRGIVFCCFNKAYKINARIFETWMTILKKVPGSVLWLYRDNSMAVDKLQRAASHSGIQPHRLIFADKLPLPDHVERLQLADLALDTDGYNGGATTANALWAGVPVLTVRGENWVGRMTSSHLLAAGMPELIARNLDEYAGKAIRLAHSGEELGQMRAKLDRQRKKAPLFDASVFVRDLESALETIWNRYLKGLAPAHIDVGRLQISEGNLS
jgi:protein O-GlcNAc transferase